MPKHSLNVIKFVYLWVYFFVLSVCAIMLVILFIAFVTWTLPLINPLTAGFVYRVSVVIGLVLTTMYITPIANRKHVANATSIKKLLTGVWS